MTQLVQNIIYNVASILVSEVGAEQVYLFGSYANGTENSESDIDLFIVTDLTDKKKIDVTQQARRALLKKTTVPIDIVVCDKTIFESRRTNQITFEYIIATEGQKIYG